MHYIYACAHQDQGQLFILANTTYLSPCGQAQILLSDHRGTETIAVAAGWPDSSLDVVAVRDADSVTLRVVNVDLKARVEADFVVWGCSAPEVSDRSYSTCRAYYTTYYTSIYPN